MQKQRQKQRGRKKAKPGEKRDIQIMCRVNESELAEIDAVRTTKQRGAWLRDMALRGGGGEAGREAMEVWGKLARVAANLNQLAHHFNVVGVGVGDIEDARLLVEELREQLRRIL